VSKTCLLTTDAVRLNLYIDGAHCDTAFDYGLVPPEAGHGGREAVWQGCPGAVSSQLGSRL
jgi:hypothetical protein